MESSKSMESNYRVDERMPFVEFTDIGEHRVSIKVKEWTDKQMYFDPDESGSASFHTKEYKVLEMSCNDCFKSFSMQILGNEDKLAELKRYVCAEFINDDCSTTKDLSISSINP
jgi:hypothetical protein